MKNKVDNLPAYTLIMFAASVLVTGYRVYFHNQSLQLPLVLLLKDPTLFPRDPFAATLPYYASLLWRAVAVLLRVIPLEPLLLVLFVIERFITIYAAGSLARAFSPRSTLAAVAAMAFFALWPGPLLGGGTLVMPYFEQTSFAVALFMLAMAAWHKDQPLLWAAMMAAGFSTNSMYGAYALTYFGAVFLIDPDYRRAWKKWLGALAVFAILASPTALMTASAFGKHATDNALWVTAARVRVAHHLFPSTWRRLAFEKSAFLLCLAMAVFWMARTRSERLYRHGMVWCAIALAWVAYAFIAEALKSSSVLIMQPARATDLWCCFAAIGMLSVFAAMVDDACSLTRQSPKGIQPRKHERGKARNGIRRPLYRETPFPILRPRRVSGKGFPETTSVFSYLRDFVLSCFRDEEGSVYVTWLLIAGLLVWDYPIVPVYVFPAMLLLVAWKPAWRWLFDCGGPARAALLLAVAVAVVGLISFGNRVHKRGSVGAALVGRPPASERLLAAWGRNHTAKGDVFLVNPNWGEFRPLSLRPVFVTWKDGSALLWYRPFVTEWVERVGALGYDITRHGPAGTTISAHLDKLYAHLTDAEVRSLAGRYGIRWWVVSASHESAFRMAYHNKYFRVLEVNQ